MKILTSILAVVTGLRLCLLEPGVRKLAIWPWSIGAVCYAIFTYAAVKLQPILLGMLVGDGSGFVQTLLYGIAWIGVWIGLILLTLLLTLVLVLLFAGPFQTAIAARVLTLQACQVPVELGLVKEARRSIAVESLKLLWLGPLLVLVFLIGMVPWFLPIAAIMGGWLVGYQFIDIVLDLYRVPVGARFKFARQHGWMIVALGMSLGALGAIPLVGILIPPIGAAAAAWLLAKTNLLPTEEPHTVGTV